MNPVAARTQARKDNASFREFFHLDYERLANKVGCHYSTVWRWWNWGRIPSKKNQAALREMLGVHAKYLTWEFSDE
jgi:DNA invertase Pin-like site-specific DNA recombinase